MNELRALLSLELRSLYGINKLRYTRDEKTKRRYQGLALVWVLVIGVVFFYVGGLVYSLCSLGLAGIVPAYLCVLASLLILAFGLFTSGSRLFGARGYDLLASMPISSGKLVLSRFLGLYAEDLVFSAVILVPGIGVYAYLQRPGLGFYLVSLVGMVLIPAIPLVISVLFGTLILAASSRMKNKSLVQSALMVLFVIVVLVGSFAIGPASENFTAEQFAGLAQRVGGLFGRIYPPAMWLNAACQGSILYLLPFAAFSLGVMGAMVWVVSASFHGIMRRLMRISARHNYQLRAMEHRSLLKALYIREAKRYFASSTYVTNTIVGPILGTIMAIALCVSGPETILSVFPVPIDLMGLLPFVFSAVFCMMTTTSVSISMEGGKIWITKSLPIPTKAWLDSKILLNLSLTLPCFLVAEIAFILGLKPDFLSVLWLLLIPGSVMVLSVVLGITVNLKFYSFDWEKEETVVKQSLPAMLGGFAGLLISAGLGAAVFQLPEALRNPGKALICLLLWAVTAWLYHRNNQKQITML